MNNLSALQKKYLNKRVTIMVGDYKGCTGIVRGLLPIEPSFGGYIGTLLSVKLDKEFVPTGLKSLTVHIEPEEFKSNG